VFGETPCIWVDIDGMEKKCMLKEVKCESLTELLCQEYEEISKNINSLIVLDSRCFINGKDEEKAICESKSLFLENYCNDLKTRKYVKILI
jgi:hypothetical protein